MVMCEVARLLPRYFSGFCFGLSSVDCRVTAGRLLQCSGHSPKVAFKHRFKESFSPTHLLVQKLNQGGMSDFDNHSLR